MDKAQFAKLKQGDRIRFHGRIFTIESVEAWVKSPGVRETDAITVTGGNRAKINDTDVQDMELVIPMKTCKVAIYHRDSDKHLMPDDTDQIYRNVAMMEFGCERPNHGLKLSLYNAQDGEIDIVYASYNPEFDSVVVNAENEN